MKAYRNCVVAAIVNDEGLFLAGERSDKPGVWQLPQGGVEDGESDQDALVRELQEEIGCGEVEVLKVAKNRISYDFPPSLKAPIADKYSGQSQRWFLVRFKPGQQADLSQGDGEFSDLDWKSSAELLENVVDWKKDAYVKGFAELG
ncbi:MAG: RNA pyrophosphohydrolase [Pseudobacteriovorax sp.]|nr:RNA pyrophosphohydrolase [Pseudobacteriovorax sp.]